MRFGESCDWCRPLQWCDLTRYKIEDRFDRSDDGRCFVSFLSRPKTIILRMHSTEIRIKTLSNFYVCWPSQCCNSFSSLHVTSRGRTIWPGPNRNNLLFQWSVRNGFFYVSSHHHGTSVFYLTENMFPPGKLPRAINLILNYHHQIVFRNGRDPLGVLTLARQMYPKQHGFLMKAYRDATTEPYGIYGSIAIPWLRTKCVWELTSYRGRNTSFTSNVFKQHVIVSEIICVDMGKRETHLRLLGKV